MLHKASSMAFPGGKIQENTGFRLIGYLSPGKIRNPEA